MRMKWISKLFKKDILYDNNKISLLIKTQPQQQTLSFKLAFITLEVVTVGITTFQL